MAVRMVFSDVSRLKLVILLFVVSAFFGGIFWVDVSDVVMNPGKLATDADYKTPSYLIRLATFCETQVTYLGPAAASFFTALSLQSLLKHQCQWIVLPRERLLKSRYSRDKGSSGILLLAFSLVTIQKLIRFYRVPREKDPQFKYSVWKHASLLDYNIASEVLLYVADIAFLLLVAFSQRFYYRLAEALDNLARQITALKTVPNDDAFLDGLDVYESVEAELENIQTVLSTLWRIPPFVMIVGCMLRLMTLSGDGFQHLILSLNFALWAIYWSLTPFVCIFLLGVTFAAPGSVLDAANRVTTAYRIVLADRGRRIHQGANQQTLLDHVDRVWRMSRDRTHGVSCVGFGTLSTLLGKTLLGLSIAFLAYMIDKSRTAIEHASASKARDNKFCFSASGNYTEMAKALHAYSLTS